MAAQKHKKNCQQKLCSIFECFYPKTLLIQCLNSLDSSRPYGIKKQGALRNCLPKNDFQNSSTKVFPKKHPDCEGLETNRRHKIHTF